MVNECLQVLPDSMVMEYMADENENTTVRQTVESWVETCLDLWDSVEVVDLPDWADAPYMEFTVYLENVIVDVYKVGDEYRFIWDEY